MCMNLEYNPLLPTVTGVTHDIPHGPPQRVKYRVSADEAHRFGLPCGGTRELLRDIEPA